MTANARPERSPRRAGAGDAGATAALVVMLLLIGVTGAAGADPAPRGAPGFRVFLRPPPEPPGEGESFVVHLEVDASAVQFNAYELTLGFDPEVLRLDMISPGQLMQVEGCGPAFFLPTTGDSTGMVAHSLLCADASVDGPGVLSTWHFTALACTAPDTTFLRFESDPDRMFADAGLWVWPGHPTYPRQVVPADSALVVCEILDVPAAGTAIAPTRMWPNPWRGARPATLEVTLPGPAGRLDLFDAAGRRVWSTPVPAGVIAVGLPAVPPGIYLYSVHRGPDHHTGRFARIP